MHRFLLMLLSLFVSVEMAFGEEVAATTQDLPDGFVGTLIAGMIGLQIALRGLAEGLTRIAKLTPTGIDNKIASYLGQAAWFLGTFLGKFGYSVPTLVLEECVEKKKQKTAAADADAKADADAVT